MRTITLAYALKEKKRIAGKMAELRNIIRCENVKYEDEKQRYDLTEINKELSEHQKHLIELKSKIAAANAMNSISEHIYEMEELKSELSMWKNLRIDDDPEYHYSAVSREQLVRNKVCQFDHTFVSQIREELQLKIEELQDRIDELNATVHIQLSYD